MHPLVYILGAFVCPLAFVVLGAVAVDNWNAGNRIFALVMGLWAALAVWGLNAAFDGVADAYRATMEAQDGR